MAQDKSYNYHFCPLLRPERNNKKHFGITRILHKLTSWGSYIFIFSIKIFVAQLCRLPSNIGFPNTSNGLIFLKLSGTVLYRCSSEFVFLKFSKISQESTCVEVFLNKITGLQVCNNIKKKIHYRCVRFPKFLITLFLQNTSDGCFWELL